MDSFSKYLIHDIYSDFYSAILQRLKTTFTVSDESLKTAMAELSSYYQGISRGLKPVPREPDYSSFSQCLAYLHRYAAAHATLVRTSMLHVLKQPESPLSVLLKEKKSLQVMFFGSGPGNDFVGVLGALYGMRKNFDEVRVVCVDRAEKWKHVIDFTVRRLKSGYCGNVGLFFQEKDISVEFCEEDFVKESLFWKNDTLQRLENSDLVFLVKVFANIPLLLKSIVIKNIVSHMKNNSFLILIDWPLELMDSNSYMKDLCLVHYKPKTVTNFLVKRLLDETSIWFSTCSVWIFQKKDSTALMD